VGQVVFRGDVHEPRTIDFVVSHCKDGDIVHAGAYFGDFLPALSRACIPGAKIWTFEPNPENYRCALITLDINGLRNVELTNAALGERQDSLVMLTIDAKGSPLGGGSRILAPGSAASPEATATVPSVAVDEVVPPDRRVSVIQLDVEGYEQQALAGALGTIQRCLPVIVVETLPADDWLSENILRLGYRVAPESEYELNGNNFVLTRD